MYKIAIVGLGPAGIFALAMLPRSIQAHTIVFECGAVGGSLATEYGAVVANITKSIIISALKEIPGWNANEFLFLEKYGADDCPLLNDVVRQLRQNAAPDIAVAKFHNARVLSYTHLPSNKWQLNTSSGLFEAQKLVLCTGATPKTLDLPTPTIPLHIALNPSLLPNFVLPTDRVVVFGAAHSGTLALRNLRDAGVKQLTCLYKGDTPFLFARDGHTEGIKQESAAIADSLLSTHWARLVNIADFATAHRAVAEADAVVYAIGFERPVPTYTDVDGSVKHLLGADNVFAFGIGSPSMYTAPNGAMYPDVGFGGFITAIKAALPSMLTFDS